MDSESGSVGSGLREQALTYAVEELENYMREEDDHDICRACGSPMDAAHGMAAHDELCPLFLVLESITEPSQPGDSTPPADTEARGGKPVAKNDLLHKIELLENHIIALEQEAELPEDERSYRVGFDEGFTMAHEPAGCGHARANWKDPDYGTTDYSGNEKCEFCAALAPSSPSEGEPVAWQTRSKGTNWLTHSNDKRLPGEEIRALYTHPSEGEEAREVDAFATVLEEIANSTDMTVKDCRLVAMKVLTDTYLARRAALASQAAAQEGK